MACDNCFTTLLKEKLGRCKRCMWQLTLLSLICWPLWFWLYLETPKQVESIALLFFCCAFSGLLALHLLIWGYRKLLRRGRTPKGTTP